MEVHVRQQVMVRPKKLFICSSGTLNPPPHHKFVLYLQCIDTEKIVYTSQIFSLGHPSFAAILFVNWLARIIKVGNFSGNYSATSFYSFIQKI